MAEHSPPDAPAEAPVAGVDAAMAALEEVEARPVEEHPEVFERAHAHLRGALDGTHPGAASERPARP